MPGRVRRPGRPAPREGAAAAGGGARDGTELEFEVRLGRESPAPADPMESPSSAKPLPKAIAGSGADALEDVRSEPDMEVTDPDMEVTEERGDAEASSKGPLGPPPGGRAGAGAPREKPARMRPRRRRHQG